MLKNKILLSTAITFMLFSFSLFGMDIEEGSEKQSSIQCSNSMPQIQAFLDWKNRPESTKKYIDSAFLSVAKQASSHWKIFNGSKYYGICGIDDEKIVKQILLDAYKEKRDVYLMDVGAGNFQWGRHMAKFVNKVCKQETLSENMTIHIFSLRGEDGAIPEEKDGNCVIHNLTNCKIEDLNEQLSKYNINNKFDLIVSHWCFRHFADPLGTFIQTYNFLRPSTGLLSMDGFFMLHETATMDTADHNQNILFVLQDTKAPFLILPYNNVKSLNQFVLKRPDDKPCQLPMSYIDTISLFSLEGNWGVGSKAVTRFHCSTSHTLSEKVALSLKNCNKHPQELYGDQELYSFFSKHNIFIDSIIYGGGF